MSLYKQCLSAENMRDKILNCLSFMTLFVAFCVLLVLFAWKLYPYKPLTIVEPIKIHTPVVSQGGLLIYETDFCRNTKIKPIVKRRFSNGIVYSLPDIVAINKQVGCNTNRVGLEVPHALPEGDYVMYFEFVYRMNPLRQVTVIAETESFKVINGR